MYQEKEAVDKALAFTDRPLPPLDFFEAINPLPVNAFNNRGTPIEASRVPRNPPLWVLVGYDDQLTSCLQGI